MKILVLCILITAVLYLIQVRQNGYVYSFTAQVQYFSNALSESVIDSNLSNIKTSSV